MKNLSKTLIIILLIMNASYRMNAQQKPISDQLIVQVNLNGKSAWALLDPSTDFTIFNTKEKDDFDFHIFTHSFNNHRVQVQHESLVFEVVGGADLSLGNVPLYGAKLGCDLSKIIQEIEKKSGKTISLIIGKNMMKHHGFILDLGNNSVTVNKQIFEDSLSLKQSYSLIKEN